MASINTRAILSDIHDFDLDPKIAHTVNGKTKRLRTELIATKAVVDQTTEETTQPQVIESVKMTEASIVADLTVDEDKVDLVLEKQEVKKVESNEDEKLDDVDKHVKLEVDHTALETEEQKLDD